MVHVHIMWELHYLPTFADFSLFTFSISSWKCNFYHTWPLRLPHHSLLDSASNSLIFLLASIPCPHSFTKNKFKCKKGKTALHVLPQEWCGKRINERKKNHCNFLPKGISYIVVKEKCMKWFLILYCLL